MKSLGKFAQIEALLLLGIFLLGFTSGAVAQDTLHGRVFCQAECSNLASKYSIELMHDDSEVASTSIETGFMYQFLDVCPEDGMSVTWFKTSSSADGLYPIVLSIHGGKVNGTFRFYTANDLFYKQKCSVLDKIKMKKAKGVEKSFSDMLSFNRKMVDIDQNLYYSMIKELDYQMVSAIEGSYRSDVTSSHIDDARAIKRETMMLILNGHDIQYKTAKLVAQVKSWIEFARLVYRFRQRNFAKSPTTANGDTEKYKFFLSDDMREKYIDDVQLIQNVLSKPGVDEELMQLVDTAIKNGKINTEQYPRDLFNAIFSGDLIAEDVDMAVLSHYINAIYNPKFAS